MVKVDLTGTGMRWIHLCEQVVGTICVESLSLLLVSDPNTFLTPPA